MEGKRHNMYGTVLMTSFLFMAGSVSGEQELPNKAFNQSLSVLAQSNGVSLSYDVTVVALISEVTNISFAGVGDIMQRLGASSTLVSYLNTTTVSQTIDHFYGINQIYNNFTVSAYNMTIMLIKLDSTKTTQVKLQILKTQVPTTEDAIAEVTNVSREELLNTKFLTEFNPTLPSIADQITMNSTKLLITELGLTEQQFEVSTKVNVTYFNHLRALSFVALVRENPVLAENLTMTVDRISMQARNTLIRTLLFNMSMVRADCPTSISNFNDTQFSDIYSQCIGFNFSTVATALNIKDVERRELLARLTPAEMKEIAKLSSVAFDAIQVGQLIVLVNIKLRPIVGPLGVPISVSSYLAKIAFATLPNYLILDWATKVAKISESIILKSLSLSGSGANTLKTTRFVNVPESVRLNLGANYSVNHFLTVSFQGLVKILVTEKTPAVAIEEFTHGATYLAKRLDLKDLQAVYGVTRAHLLPLTLPGLSQTYAGITPDQLQMVLNLTKEEKEKLNRVSIEDAGIILHKASIIFRRTLEEIGHEIINTGRETDVLHNSSRDILMNAGRADLINTTTLFKIIVIYGQVTPAAYQKLLAGLRASTTFSAVIKENPQVSFAASLNLSVDAVSKTPLLTFLKTLKRRWDQEPRVCSVVTHQCGSHARCWSSSGGSFTCRCFVGYKRYEGKCEKRRVGPNYVLIGVLVGSLVVGLPVLFMIIYIAKKRHLAYSGAIGFTKASGGDGRGSADRGF